MSFLLLNADPKIYPDKARGAFIYHNGQKYVDMCLGNGTHIFGHHDWDITGGTSYGTPCKEAWEFAEELQKATKLDKFVLCNTGSEATMRAARIARSRTGKKKIAIFEGSWHGSADWSLDSEGVLQEVKDNILWLPYGTENALDIIKKNKDSLAMVFIEPVQGSNPQDYGWLLKELRRVTYENDILLGFDEVVTGFRLALGGGQEYFKVSADICTYGKTIGGGFPIGVVGVKDHIKVSTFLGGTFSGNPVSISAGLATLKQLRKENPYEMLNEMGKKLREVQNKKFYISGVGSFNRPIFTKYCIASKKERDAKEDLEVKKKFYDYIFKNKIYIGSNGLTFVSTEHEPLIDRIVNVFKNFSCRTNVNKNR